MPLSDPQDQHDLDAAVEALETPGVTAQMADAMGRPIESGLQRLPAKTSQTVEKATSAALRQGLNFAIRTLGERGDGRPRNLTHKLAITGLGGVGGAMGLFALPVELPASTVVMLRSIADIARAEGEDLKDLETRLACLEVFALGARHRGDDAAEVGYLAARAALAKATRDAARHLAGKTVTGKLAAPVARLLSTISSRFSVAVTEKIAAQAIPAVGALGGATINLIFINHFQNVARGHFTMRRLGRTYDEQVLTAAYVEARDRLTGRGKEDAASEASG